MRGLILLVLMLSACSTLRKLEPVRDPQPVLSRGWSYVEPRKEAEELEAGVAPVSYSAPVLAGEKLLFGSDRFGLTALARKNGQVLWQKKFSEEVVAAPLVRESQVFVGTAAGELYQLDIDTGIPHWSVALSGPVHGTMLNAFDRLFVATADDALHAVDPATGKVLWSYRRPSLGGTSVRGGGNPAAIAGDIWIGFSDGALVSLDPQTGAVKSDRLYRDNLKFMDLDAKVVGWKEGLLVTTYDGKLRFVNRDGNQQWEFPAGGARTPVLVEGDIVYLAASDGIVYALAGNSGKELWRFALPRGVPTGTTFVNHQGRKALVVTGSEEKLFVLEAGTGKLLATGSLGQGSGSYAPVALEPNGNRFYVLSHFSRVHEYQIHL